MHRSECLDYIREYMGEGDFLNWLRVEVGQEQIHEAKKIKGRQPGVPKKHREDWFGIKGARFIYHGDWSDPEIEYDGITIPYWDVESWLLDIYREEHPEDRNDDGFDEWMAQPEQKSEIQSALDCIAQSYAEEMDDRL